MKNSGWPLTVTLPAARVGVQGIAREFSLNRGKFVLKGGLTAITAPAPPARDAR